MEIIDRSKVSERLLDALSDFVGKELASEITEATDPIKDLGRDSPDGIDFACVLCEVFDCEVPVEVNPFVDDERKCSRCASEIIDMVCELLNQEQQ